MCIVECEAMWYFQQLQACFFTEYLVLVFNIYNDTLKYVIFLEEEKVRGG